MSKVINFEEKKYDEWWNVMAICTRCNHRCIATVHVETPLFNLECPNCGECESFVSFFPDEYVAARRRSRGGNS